MEPNMVRHIKVQPRRTLERSSSTLGRGGNSMFSVTERTSAQKQRLESRPLRVTLPPPPVLPSYPGTEISENVPSLLRPSQGGAMSTLIQSITTFGVEQDSERKRTNEGTESSAGGRNHQRADVPGKIGRRSNDDSRPISTDDTIKRGEYNWKEDDVGEQATGTTTDKDMNIALRMVLAYWQQIAQKGEASVYFKPPTKEEIKRIEDRVYLDTELEGKDRLYQEVKYLFSHFKQRRCAHYCKEEKESGSCLQKVVDLRSTLTRDFCACGAPKDYHTDKAITNQVAEWDKSRHTELVQTCSFGNLDIPGHYNYLETPRGTRKYVRFDDLETNPAHIWTLLTKHWDLKTPNLVITVTGGDMKWLHQNNSLQQSFTNGILKSAVTTKAWIITDGFHVGAAREISTIFQEHLQRSQWSEYEDHASIPLIGFPPWGMVADRKHLHGINVGVDEAIYLYTSIEKQSHASIVPNALDPYHVIYLLPDDGTTGHYKNEPVSRRRFEKYIRNDTSLTLIGAKDVHTPVVILVLGGDEFTLEKIADCISKKNQISVVIVNGSGPVANMLAEVYHRLQKESSWSRDHRYGWSEQEEEIMNDLINKFKASLLRDSKDEGYLREIMKARHLIRVFGVSEKDTKDLDKAILEATFGGTKNIAVQLNLTLAMDRCDIASTCIFTESRKQELKEVSEMLQEVLLVAMETGRTKFVELLLDQDYGGELDFQKLLTVQRLYRLHNSNLDPSRAMGKVLRSMCKRETDGSYLLAQHQLLPQIGRIIYFLMGDNYRLLYQEKEYRKVSTDVIPLKLTQHPKEEPAWHLLLWACLANQKDMAELFLFETSCKIGAALIAFEMFSELSRRAAVLSETELSEELRETADYFQTLAMEILDNLYAFDRVEAYASITAVIPFRWSNYATPLHIADDTEAMRFMGHACCQTLLNRIWYRYMDLDTRTWRFIPFFVLFPVNLVGIVFDKENLSYGTYRSGYKSDAEQTKTSHSMSRQRNVSENLHALSSEALGHSFNEGKHAGSDESTASRQETFCARGLFRLVNYYTSPVNKFVLSFLFWLIFVALFTYFLLDDLRPLNRITDMSVYEWLIIVWVACISLDELKQLIMTKSSGPLYKLSWQEIRKYWAETWHVHERLFFLLRLYKVTNWVEDGWNKLDLVMIICFWASVICRFLISAPDFTIVRILFSITIILFYYRILRISYIMENIGPRVITIHTMMKDLANFMLVLSIILVSFGVAFQAILSPNQPASVDVLVDVLWRPYWQMFGELFIDDATTSMGRLTENQITCTYNRTVANEQPEIHPFCYHWMAPVLLGVFMLFTNILLLNLLIAIFSHSFEKIESEAQTIWRYHLYDLVHEYYYQVWLPPPLNILCYLFNIVSWLSKWPRKWAYQSARRRILKRMNAKHTTNNLLEKQVEDELKKDWCYKFYYTEANDKDITHFRQPEIMRNEDLEEKAYKRYLRSAARKREKNISKMLQQHTKRLMEIAATVEDFKNSTSSEHLSDLNRSLTSSHGGFSLAQKINNIDTRLKDLDRKLDAILREMDQSVV